MIRIINAVNDKKSIIDFEYKNCTLNELILELGIDKLSIGSILINGVPAKLNEGFEDNSEIYLLPVLSGGC